MSSNPNNCLGKLYYNLCTNWSVQLWATARFFASSCAEIWYALRKIHTFFILFFTYCSYVQPGYMKLFKTHKNRTQNKFCFSKKKRIFFPQKTFLQILTCFDYVCLTTKSVHGKLSLQANENVFSG